MTRTCRIVLNIAATYGRSLLALVCGLFTARWALGALGAVDYGLWGLLVGMVGFVSVVNGLLGSALSRFFALTLGEKGDGQEDNLRGWFAAGVVLLFVVGTLMVAVGYPVGVFALRHWMVIPTERLDSCLWAWRWCCLGCWIGMVTAPWSAMYTAKQLIAELSLYSLLSTIANVCLAGWMISHPGDWLSTYAFAMMLISMMPNAIVSLRGSIALKACRPLWAPDLWPRVGRIVAYSALNAVQALGWLLSNSGIAIVANWLCGPVLNGALSISNSVKTHSAQLSNAMQGAFTPVIATAYGAGDFATVRTLALRVSKFAVVSTAVFALPLVLELETVLRLWLKNPPDGTWELCITALALLVTDAFGVGYRTAIYASGRLLLFVLLGESILLLTLPVTWIMWRSGLGIWSFGCSYLTVTLFNVLARVAFARGILKIRASDWLRELVFPVLITLLVAGALGYLMRYLCAPSFLRVLLTAGLAEAVFLSGVWSFVLNAEERSWIRGRLWMR